MSERLGAPRPRQTPMRAAYEDLRLERRQPMPVETVIVQDTRLADLRECIHLLAMAMTDGKAVA